MFSDFTTYLKVLNKGLMVPDGMLLSTIDQDKKD